jgi:hypothetical protein
VLGDYDNRAFVGRVTERGFTIRRSRRPGNWMTPILRGSFRELQNGGTSIELILVPYALTRLGLLAQIGLILFMTLLGALAALGAPIFAVGALFVLAIQVMIALTGVLARRREWPTLTHFVCGALGGALRPTDDGTAQSS